MKKFYLIDYDHNKAAKKQEKLYMVASKIALKYGQFGRHFKNCNELHIQEFWDGDDCPSFSYFLSHVRVPIVKWYIHNKIDLSNEIWNGDFLHGVATVGKINWSKHNFPSLAWRHNDVAFDLLKKCGFGGELRHYDYAWDKYLYRWFGVPALYLKYDESSISFMAGVLATGMICKKHGYTYARYNGSAKKFFKKWAIPIEEEEDDGRYLLLSPIWAALFAPKMPSDCWVKWYDLSKPFGADIYPSILWKTYANNDFPTKGIPYLKSRRWIYNHYKSEKGAMKTLERERVNRNLTEIDMRVREMVHEWKENYKEGVDIK